MSYIYEVVCPAGEVCRCDITVGARLLFLYGIPPTRHLCLDDTKVVQQVCVAWRRECVIHLLVAASRHHRYSPHFLTGSSAQRLGIKYIAANRFIIIEQNGQRPSDKRCNAFSFVASFQTFVLKHM